MERGMTLDEVKEFISEFLENYDIECKVPIKFNKKLTKIVGRVMIKMQSPVWIEFSSEHFAYQKKDLLIDIIKHECIHYALCVMGKPFHDGEAEFEAELKKHNAPSIVDPERFVNLEILPSKLKSKFVYLCDNGHKLPRKEKLDKEDKENEYNQSFSCECHARLKYLGLSN